MIINAKAPEGNAFLIMVEVRKFLKETGREAEWASTRHDMMSDDYDHLCVITEEITHGVIKVVNRD